MNRRIFYTVALPAAILVMGGSDAHAALQCITQPTCTALGYSKETVADCQSYLYCPFDTSYKKCVSGTAGGDCSKYTLTSCPSKGICISCTSGSTIKYALVGCETGYAEVAGLRCKKSYASCEDAGYFTNDTNRDCSSENFIYTTNGTPKNCYTSCTCKSGYTEDDSGNCVKVKVYASCEDAGYFSNDINRTCGSETATIYLSNGSTKTCYTSCSCNTGYVEDQDGDCVKAYASCEEAGYTTSPAGESCATATIYLTNGTKKVCYGSCSSSQGGSGSDYNDCVTRCSLSHAYACEAGSAQACANLRDCIGMCGMNTSSNDFLPPSTMMAVDTISEEQCKIKYTNNLSSDQSCDDCVVYNA